MTDIANHQPWWIEYPEEKSVQNSGKRKLKYRKFYSMFRSMGLWANEQYLQKKQLLMTANRITVGRTNRELMPDCVTGLVRVWLPNPDGKQYLGHKWINNQAVVVN